MCKKGAHRGCVREGWGTDRHSRPAPSPQPPGSPETQRGLSLNLAEGTCPRLASVEPQVWKVFYPMTLIMSLRVNPKGDRHKPLILRRCGPGRLPTQQPAPGCLPRKNPRP